MHISPKSSPRFVSHSGLPKTSKPFLKAAHFDAFLFSVAFFSVSVNTERSDAQTGSVSAPTTSWSTRTLASPSNVPVANLFLRKPSAAAPAALDTESAADSASAPFFPLFPFSDFPLFKPISTNPSVALLAIPLTASGSHSFVAAPYTLTVTNFAFGFLGKENTCGTQTESEDRSSWTSVCLLPRSEFKETLARKLVVSPSRGVGKSLAPHTWKYTNELLSILFT
mmetsp:Transcript_12875/g.48141  ORF Transcript_12875/g.48141 Transcript_12875/m.48141 type:complete len:225 (+) Transcript_12875:744-1418(+)